MFATFKDLTNQLYLDTEGNVIQITNVNQYLCAMSVRNKAITVEILATKEELIISLEQLQAMAIKYLGNNPEAACILYEKVLRGNNEETHFDFDSILQHTEPSDD